MFHVAFTSASAAAKSVLVAPVLGQLHEEFSKPVQRAGPVLGCCFASLCLPLSVGSVLFCLVGPSELTRPAPALGQFETLVSRQTLTDGWGSQCWGTSGRFAFLCRGELSYCDRPDSALIERATSLSLRGPYLRELRSSGRWQDHPARTSAAGERGLDGGFFVIDPKILAGI
jgi:hypothetical protein